MKIQYCWFAVFFVFFSASGQSRTLGIDENQVNLIPAYDFDLAGSWTAITYDVVWDNIAEKVVRFEPVDTIRFSFSCLQTNGYRRTGYLERRCV